MLVRTNIFIKNTNLWPGHRQTGQLVCILLNLASLGSCELCIYYDNFILIFNDNLVIIITIIVLNNSSY